MDELDNLLIKAKIRNKKRQEAMIFDYGTTALTDFRYGRILPRKPLTKYREKAQCLMPWKDPLMNTHSLTSWNEGKIRFDLFIKPKEIVRTDPRKIQECHEKPEDTGRAKAQRTRPRLVMTPAVSMDDIEDSTTRQILCEDMYTTTAVKAMLEGVQPHFRVAAPFSGKNSKSNPIALPKYGPPVVPAEWRMDSVSWDNRELRCFCDPTKEFWLKYPQPNCRSCYETAIMRQHREAKLAATRQQ